MKIVYIAHPLRGATPEETAANRRAASALTAELSLSGDIAPVCSWIVLSEHWTEEQGSALVLRCALIARCDELWLCGPMQPLSADMQIEYDHAVACGLRIVDLRGLRIADLRGLL